MPRAPFICSVSALRARTVSTRVHSAAEGRASQWPRTVGAGGHPRERRCGARPARGRQFAAGHAEGGTSSQEKLPKMLDGELRGDAGQRWAGLRGETRDNITKLTADPMFPPFPCIFQRNLQSSWTCTGSDKPLIQYAASRIPELIWYFILLPQQYIDALMSESVQ